MKQINPARRAPAIAASCAVSMLLLAVPLGAPALASASPGSLAAWTETPVDSATTVPTATSVPAPTPTPTMAPTATATATAGAAARGAASTTADESVLQVSPELSLALKVVDGPARNAADGTYSVTYELVVTQAGDATIEPLSLLGFTTTSDIVSNEAALEENESLASRAAGVTSARSAAAPAATATATTTATTTATATAVPRPTLVPTATAVPEIVERASIGLAKRVVSAPQVVDGAFEFTYEVLVSNTGNGAVKSLRVVDSLVDVFGADAEIDVVRVVSNGSLLPNKKYDGVDDAELLATGQSLAAGKKSRLLVSVAVLPSTLGVYEMNAAVSATTASGRSLIDVSTDGTEVDADEDGDASDDSEPTPVSLTSEQSIELSLRVLRGASEVSDGVFAGTLALTVKNPGPFNVEQVQIHESFAVTDETRLRIASATSDTLSVNPWFDGQTDIAMLSGEDTLAVGESGVVVVEVTTSVEDLQDLQQITSVQASDPFGSAIKAGSAEVLAAVPAAPTKPDSRATGDDDAPVEAQSAATPLVTRTEPTATAEPAVDDSAAMEETPVVNPTAVEAAPVVDPTATEDINTEVLGRTIEVEDRMEVASAAIEPHHVSGAMRVQYQVGIAGMIALVLALVGGGTAAGINRRERTRARRVAAWLDAK